MILSAERLENRSLGSYKQQLFQCSIRITGQVTGKIKMDLELDYLLTLTIKFAILTF